MAERRQREPCHRRIVAVVGQRDVDPVGQLRGIQRAGHEEAAVLPLEHVGIGVAFAVGGKGATHCGEQVGWRDDALHMAIFVVDQRHRHRCLPQHLKHVHRVQLVEDHGRIAHQFGQHDRPALQHGGNDVARLHHAPNVVD